MNTWNKQYQYNWGYWAAQHPWINTGHNYNPLWNKGFVNGTVDYWLKKKGLK